MLAPEEHHVTSPWTALYIRTGPYLVLVYDWDPYCLHYWGIVVYSVLIWLKMRLQWQIMFSN